VTPENENSPLQDNGSSGTFPQQLIGIWENQTVAVKLTHVSAAMDIHRRIEELLQNPGHVTVYIPDNGPVLLKYVIECM
jgi:hypothetical protein